MKERVKNIISGVAGSYSQVFFSNNRWLAFFLLLATMVDPVIGLSGLLSVLCAIAFGNLLGLNPAYIRNGWYTYNVLLTGLAMGANFQFSSLFLLMLVFSSLLSLMLSVWLASFTAKYRLPFLSLPFVLSVWIVFLNARSFQSNLFVERNAYLCHDVFARLLKNISLDIEQMGLHRAVLLYFRSMASIFFQNNLVAGILISAGLLISSRITFFLSWFGFLAGYVFFKFAFGPNAASEYYYAGFNYVFAAIAVAGFYLVPSAGSYLLVILSVPLIALFNTALLRIMGPYFLPLYSLPFSLTVIVIISVLNNRYSSSFFDFVQYQQYSPEKNLYAFYTYMERFKKDTLVHIHLPFYGEWSVSQGHSGDITHKEDWKYALDFVVTDEHRQTFKLPGKAVTDFYCYSLPVLAPADGEVITVEDGIEDNAIGDVNLQENWGNTIIIKHNDYLYSKLSHLKKNSIKVKAGEPVKRGELIAQCGNSGRSPEPHIHFQLQNKPYIGAPTLNYPLSYYIVKKENTFKLHAFGVPEKGDVLLRPLPTPLIRQAFHFIPGMKLNFEISAEGKASRETWEVMTDAYNSSYLYCTETRSAAHFTNNETLFYFTGFSGDKNSLLYHFYLAAYKVLLSHYPGLEINDRLPVETSHNHYLKPLQDLVAPFYIFMKPRFWSAFRQISNGDQVGAIYISSAFCERDNDEKSCSTKFDIEIFENRINKITITKNNTCLVAKNIG